MFIEAELIVIVAVEVDAAFFGSALVRALIHILSLTNKLASGQVSVLDKRHAVNIHRRNDVVLVLLQQRQHLFVLVEEAFVDHFEQGEERYVDGYVLARVVLAGDENGRLALEMVLQLILDLRFELLLHLDECIVLAAGDPGGDFGHLLLNNELSRIQRN